MINIYTNHLKLFVFSFMAIQLILMPIAAQAQLSEVESSEVDLSSVTYNLKLLQFKSVSIDKALAEIEKKSGLIIEVDENIAGQVTVHLENINVYDALRIILNENDLAFTQGDEFVSVMTKDKFKSINGYGFNDALTSRIISLNYTKAEDLLDAVNKLKSPAGRVAVDKSANAIIVIDTPETIAVIEPIIIEKDVLTESKQFVLKHAYSSSLKEKIIPLLTADIGQFIEEEDQVIRVIDTAEKLDAIAILINEHDQPKQRYFLDTKIIQITLNDEHLAGVDWEAIVSNYQSIGFDGFDNKKKFLRRQRRLDLGTVTGEDFNILLEALDTVGIIRTVSNNSLYLDEAGSTSIFIKEVDVSFLTDDQKLNQRLEKSEKIQFLIQKAITVEDTVTMQIVPEQLSLDFHDEVEDPKEYITMSVKENDTIVIGGLFKDAIVDYTTKIPLLSELPLLGTAFSYEGQRERRTEIIVFLTPKPVNE